MPSFAFESADNPTDLIARANATLAPLLANTLTEAQFAANVSARTTGNDFSMLVTYEATGTSIATPYQINIFAGRNPDEATQALRDFVAANPGYWFGATTVFEQGDDRRVRKYLIALLYNTVYANGAANWHPLGTATGTLVNSWNGRTGAVVPLAGDYSVGLVTGAAASGVNSDITSIVGLLTPLSVNQGGTGATTAAGAQDNLAISPVSKTISYNGDGTVNQIIDSRGTKTMVYSGGVLVGIVGTGLYKQKTLNYTSGILTSITVT